MSEKNEKKEQEKSTKQPKGKFLKKFIVFIVVCLAISPFFYYDMATMKEKFSSLLSYFEKPQEIAVIYDGNKEIEKREELARKSVEAAVIIDIAQEQLANNDVSDIDTVDIVDEKAVDGLTLEQEISDLKEKINNIDTGITKEDVDVLSERLENIESQLARITRDNANQGFAFVVFQLRMQIELGNTFEQELAVLEAMVIDNEKMLEKISLLSDYAVSGIATETMLAKQFKDLTKPQKIAVIIPEGAPWYEKLWIKVRSFVSVRKVDGDDKNASLMAAINNASGLIAENNLKGAIDILGPYKASMQQPLLDWMNMAEMNIESENIINSMMSSAVVSFSAERLM